MTDPKQTEFEITEKINVLDACEILLNDCNAFLDSIDEHVTTAVRFHHPVLFSIGKITGGYFPPYLKKRIQHQKRMQDITAEMIGYAGHLIKRVRAGFEISLLEKDVLQDYLDTADPYVIALNLYEETGK